MRYLVLLLFVSCSIARLDGPSNYKQMVKKRVYDENSYGGINQDSFKITSIKSLGEIDITRIRKYHRRFNYEVTISFVKDCFQLGNTCVNPEHLDDTKFFTLRRKGESTSIIKGISFLKVNGIWKEYESIWQKREKTLID